ncbi:FtsK/SpoIIIE domain-containing protein [Streptomyces rishiriensis]|uniref:type IV secretory system conjugative DNA transfer family protein n=1 Tax=Streptomyces rishiriensis TaxID=68264 RepID=UPI0037ADB271
MSQAVKQATSPTEWEVDEGVRRLPPLPRTDGRLALAGGLFTAGAGALAFTTGDPSLIPFACGSAVVAGLAGVSNRRGVSRGELADQLTEQVCPLLGLPAPSRNAIKLSGWSEGFVGTPSKVVLVYAARIIPDPVWLGKVIAVVEQSLDGRYKVGRHHHRKHRLELERYEPEAAAVEEQSSARTRQVVAELLGESAQVDIETGEEGELTRIKVKHDQGNNMAMANRRQRVQKILATRVPGNWEARWDLQLDQVEFFIRTPMPTLVHPPQEHSQNAVAHEAYMDFEVPLGVDEDSDVLTWFPRKQAHMLVVGQSGSGKTVVLHNVVERLTQAGWRTWILDGKRIEFIGFRSWPNVELVASRLEHQAKMVVDAHALMMQRYELIESGEATLADFEPLALVIDEATTFLKGVDRWWKQVKPKGAQAKAPILDLLADMARLARSAKIHVVLGLQRPDVEFIGGEMRDNFGARVAMGRLSPQGAMMMWDSAAIGTAVPRHIKGRGTALNASGSPVSLQTYLAQNPDANAPGYDHEATEAVRPRELFYASKLIEVLEPTLTDIDGDERPRMYDDYMDARVYEAQEQPRVRGESGAVPAGPAGSALGALQSLTGSKAKRAAPAAQEQSDALELEEESLPDEPPPSAGELEGFDPETDDIGVLELCAGDLVLIDPEAGRWAVVQEDPEPDADDEVFLDLVDWQSGEPESTSLPAHEMVQARRVMQEA